MAEEIAIQKSFWNRTRAYFGDVRVEMKRVTWPNKQEIYGTTVMVIATTFAFAFFFWICDSTFQVLVGRLLSWLGHKA
ncbi:MAG TPA: preprotein translocase subunit SecE [Terriglobales bacterium]